MIKRRRYGNKQQQSTIPKREKEKPNQARQLDSVDIFVPTAVFLFLCEEKSVKSATSHLSTVTSSTLRAARVSVHEATPYRWRASLPK